MEKLSRQQIRYALQRVKTDLTTALPEHKKVWDLISAKNKKLLIEDFAVVWDIDNKDTNKIITL